MKKRSQAKIRLLLVDDHPIVLEGIRTHLEKQPGFEVVGEAKDGEEALQKARALDPEIMLLDISMPGMNGLETVARLRRDYPQIKVLILTMHCQGEYISKLIAAGVRGYILKDSSPAELVQGIQLIHEGEVYFSPSVSKIVLDQLVRGRNNAVAPNELTTLSARERDVLVLIAEGMANKQIASRLKVGVRTVESHREHVMQKLGIHSVAGLTRFAIARGLVPLSAPPGN